MVKKAEVVTLNFGPREGFCMSPAALKVLGEEVRTRQYKADVKDKEVEIIY